MDICITALTTGTHSSYNITTAAYYVNYSGVSFDSSSQTVHLKGQNTLAHCLGVDKPSPMSRRNGRKKEKKSMPNVIPEAAALLLTTSSY